MTTVTKGLTDKQRRYCELVAAGINRVQAVVQAGFSAKFPAQQASRLMRNHEIVAAIDRRRKDANSCDLPLTSDPLQFLLSIMNSVEQRASTRVAAAIAALPFVHAKPGRSAPIGKKAIADAEAKQTGETSRFKPTSPPGQLNVVPIKKQPE